MDEKHKEELYNRIDGMQKRSIKWYWEMLKSDSVMVQFQLAIILSMVYWFKLDWEALWRVLTVYYLMLIATKMTKHSKSSKSSKTGSSGLT